MSPNWSKCQLCGKTADEYCPDGNCRACHISLTFEECVSKTWNARMLLRNGHSREEVLELYPLADV